MPRECAMGPGNGFLPGGTLAASSFKGIDNAIDDWEKKTSGEFVRESGLLPIPDEDGNVLMHHWSNNKGIETLDPSMQGAMQDGKAVGLRSQNFRQGIPNPPYVSFGLNVGHPLGYKKEQGLGPVEYIAKIPVDKLYDAETDPSDFRIERNRIAEDNNIPPMDTKSRNDIYNQLIKDAGYAGFFVPNGTGYGLSAAIFEPTAVREVGPKDKEARAKSTEAKFENMKLGWDITDEDIRNYKAEADKPNFKQSAELKKLAIKKNNENPKVNLDEDYEWASAVIKNSQIETLDAVQKIPTFREMIASVGTKIAGKLIRQGGGQGYLRVPNGQRVKSRLDIPAYERADTWVVTVHTAGSPLEVIGYAKSAVLDNVEFGTFSPAAKKVAMGGGKSTFATMAGDWVDVNEVQAEQMADEALNDTNNWAEVGMNPNKYGYFYIKETGQKILSSPRVVQVGPLVMADLNGAQLEETPHSDLMAQSGINFSKSRKIRRLSQIYKRDNGIEKANLKVFKPLNKAFGTRVAMAYDAMQHNPRKPEVAEAYDALLNETLEQYRYILDAGLQVEFIPSGQKSPYSVPSEAVADILDNNHMWVYSTRDGYGEGQQNIEHPLLAPTEFMISGQVALANDIFRVVHDYFGHAKNQVGFRAEGEESAFISHSNMYSDTAVKALASETRGQNSWVNFGPFAEQNRTASEEDTVFAPQKAGLLPKELRDPKNPPA